MAQPDSASTCPRSLASLPAVLVQLMAHSLYADEISALASTCQTLFVALDCAIPWSHVSMAYVGMDQWSSTFIPFPYPKVARWQPVEVLLGDCKGGHNMSAMLELAASCGVVSVRTQRSSGYHWCPDVALFFWDSSVRYHLRTLDIQDLNFDVMEVLAGIPNLTEVRADFVDTYLYFELPALTSLHLTDPGHSAHSSSLQTVTSIDSLRILWISSPYLDATNLLPLCKSMGELTQLTLECWKQQLLDTISPSLLSAGLAELTSLQRLTFSHCGRIDCDLSVLPLSLNDLVVHVTPFAQAALRNLLASHPALRMAVSTEIPLDRAACRGSDDVWADSIGPGQG